MKPLIGITADFEESGEFRSKLKGEGRYLLREGYARGVLAGGGEPIILPYGDDPKSVIARIDGLLITGGNFDIPPELSGISDPSSARKVRPRRTDYEMSLLKGALEKDMPVLGICGGMQLMAVAAGGKMIGDIVAEVRGAMNHEQKIPRDRPGHDVNVAPDTLLRKLVGTEVLPVNSTHHQAVADPGSAIVCARATDGIIEAIEMPEKKFALGVEWHPEILFENYPPHKAIFVGFVSAAV